MPDEFMTTSQVMKFLGYHNPRGVAVWCRRRGIEPVSRQPGNKGENLYKRSQVLDGKYGMPGRGESSARWNKGRKT